MNTPDERLLAAKGLPRGSPVEIDMGSYRLQGTVHAGTAKHVVVVSRNGMVHRAPYDKVKPLATA